MQLNPKSNEGKQKIHKHKFTADALTGARDSARNIKRAPKISIRKPITQTLLKAYALITCKHKPLKITERLYRIKTFNVPKLIN